MLTSVRFKNFRILRDTTLPLTRSTLILGPNSSGKSTALQGLKLLCTDGASVGRRDLSADSKNDENAATEIVATFEDPARPPLLLRSGKQRTQIRTPALVNPRPLLRLFSLDPVALAAPVPLQPHPELAENGGNLAAVLTHLQDRFPEQFDALNDELRRWLPQFDRILFDTPAPNQRQFMLRHARDRHILPASALSHGILLALAILTIAYNPSPPDILCLEEPDRGIHPRLLRNVYDAIQRLAFPEAVGDTRKPTQVICTTHSPYLLDFYRDHPEDVVLSELTPDGAIFKRLSDLPHFADIIDNASLGDAWYSGILGGVPAAS